MDGARAAHGDLSGRLHGSGGGVFVDPRDENFGDAGAAAVRDGADAAVPGLPVQDTVRLVTADGHALQTVDRSRLRAIQTPQGFNRSVLERAHRLGADNPVPATDDAALVEQAGGRVLVVDGSAEAFKVTGPLDLIWAEALLASRAGPR